MPFRIGFTPLERRAHYKAVATGEIAPKSDSKFSAEEQKAYAQGIVDEDNRQRRVYAYKNATPEQRLEFQNTQRLKAEEYKKNKK